MKKILVSLLLAATSVVAIGAPASAAIYDGATYEELIQDPTLHNEHSIVIRFYAAVFARTPDNDGIRFWLDQYDGGEWSTRRIANFFVTGDEFVALYGEGTTNTEFVDAVYPNVLGRQPDAEGRSFWIGYLDQGNSRAEMILLVSNSPEFINANPLPSDGKAIPAPVDTAQFFDSLVRYQGAAASTDDVVSRGTAADFHVAYLDTVVAEFGPPDVTGRTSIAGGVRYTFSNGDTITYTNPVLDASGRVAHFDIDGVPLVNITKIATTSVPALGLELAGYQYVTSSGNTAIRVVILNSSAFDRETFAFDWDFNGPTGGSTKSTSESSGFLIPAGGSIDLVAIYAADATVGGSIVLEVFFEDEGFTDAQNVTVSFD